MMDQYNFTPLACQQVVGDHFRVEHGLIIVAGVFGARSESVAGHPEQISGHSGGAVHRVRGAPMAPQHCPRHAASAQGLLLRHRAGAGRCGPATCSKSSNGRRRKPFNWCGSARPRPISAACKFAMPRCGLQRWIYKKTGCSPRRISASSY